MKTILQKIILGTSVFMVTFQFSCSPAPEPRLQIGNAYAINGVSYQPKIQPRYKETGKASWYGDKFHKRLTANGDVFDKRQLTAAHKTLPLPSIVKVTNLNNGKSLNVLVNDRGPFIRGRIIDVSESAARELGFHSRGVANVSVELDENASLALLKDPRLRIKEGTKKRIVEAYTKQPQQNMLSLQNSPKSQQETFSATIPASIELAKKPVYNNEPQNMMPYSIQVASTTSETDARNITGRLKDLSSQIDKATVNGKTYFRVRVIGLARENAELALNTVKAEGFKDAFILKGSN